jgi:hypothetical protein
VSALDVVLGLKRNGETPAGIYERCPKCNRKLAKHNRSGQCFVCRVSPKRGQALARMERGNVDLASLSDVALRRLMSRCSREWQRRRAAGGT